MYLISNFSHFPHASNFPAIYQFLPTLSSHSISSLVPYVILPHLTIFDFTSTSPPPPPPHFTFRSFFPLSSFFILPARYIFDSKHHFSLSHIYLLSLSPFLFFSYDFSSRFPFISCPMFHFYLLRSFPIFFTLSMEASSLHDLEYPFSMHFPFRPPCSY